MWYVGGYPCCCWGTPPDCESHHIGNRSLFAKLIFCFDASASSKAIIRRKPRQQHHHAMPAVSGIKKEAEATSLEVTSAVVFYCLCSGGMLLARRQLLSFCRAARPYAKVHALAGE